jgi:uncharacterized protein (DUF58 family)
VRRFLLLSLLAYALFIMGLAARNGEIIALVIPFAVFLGAALLFAPKKPQLKITREMSDNLVSAGKLVQVKLTIQNEGGFLEELLIEDFPPEELEVVDGKTRMSATLPENSKVFMSYTVRTERGTYSFDRVSVRVSDSLVLVDQHFWMEASGQLFVKPEVWRLRSIAIHPWRTHLFTGPIPSRQGGSGINFFEVSEYSYGDPLRRINWKATAKHRDTLYSNRFEQERVTDVGIILDARMQTDIVLPSSTRKLNGKSAETGPVEKKRRDYPSLFEYSVHASAAVADVFLREGHRVGLLVYGRSRQATFPGYGKTQLERILRSLAQARTGDNLALESLNYLPARFFPPRSQIVLVSALSAADPPVLTRLLAFGYRLLIISPDPVSFEALHLPDSPEMEYAGRFSRLERVLILRKLQRLGIRVVDWQVDQPLERVLGTVLRITAVENLKVGIGK